MLVRSGLTDNSPVRRWITYDLSVGRSLPDNLWATRGITDNLSVRKSLTHSFSVWWGLTDNLSVKNGVTDNLFSKLKIRIH